MTRTIRFHLEGMTCASCVARAERVLQGQPGVEGASVNLGTETADLSETRRSLTKRPWREAICPQLPAPFAPPAMVVCHRH